MAGRGAVTFRLTVGILDPQILPEIQARLKDLTALFNAIIDDWTIDNEQKFNKAIGQELQGVSYPQGPTWEPLTMPYHVRKMKQGFNNHLMVRSGDTMNALTTEGAFFRMVEPQRTAFGTPNDPDAADAIMYNWKKRQTLFFSKDDMESISVFANDFVALGPRFKHIKAGVALEQMKRAAEFEVRVGGPGA